MTHVHFLFLTQNRKGVTIRTFRSLFYLLETHNVEFWILDQNSTDGTAEWIKQMAQHPKVHLYLGTSNWGVAGGRQFLLDQITPSDFVGFLDNDVMVKNPNFLDLMTSLFYQRASTGLVGAAGHWIDPTWRGYIPCDEKEPTLVDTVSGYCQLFPYRLIEECDLEMDMTFNPYWHEDTDWCMQIRSHGYEIYHAGDIGLRHIFAGSGDDGSGHSKQAYLMRKWKEKITLVRNNDQLLQPSRRSESDGGE